MIFWGLTWDGRSKGESTWESLAEYWGVLEIIPLAAPSLKESSKLGRISSVDPIIVLLL